MDRQRLFNEAVALMVEQGWERSMDEDVGSCAYSGAHGRHCAFYPAIAEYSAELLEGFSASFIMKDHSNVLHEWARSQDWDDKTFAKSLQNRHDANDVPASMIVAFRDFAVVWELDIPQALQEAYDNVRG